MVLIHELPIHVRGQGNTNPVTDGPKTLEISFLIIYGVIFKCLFFFCQIKLTRINKVERENNPKKKIQNCLLLSLEGSKIIWKHGLTERLLFLAPSPPKW